MKIVVAPDSFKGSISAIDICQSVKEGIHRVFPKAEVVQVPLADGGEGTMENLVSSTNGTTHYVEVSGPLLEKVQAAYGVLGDQETVIIEMAQASGLPLLDISQRNPMITTSYGTGELIRHALDAGYRQFIIGLGGSATNDGGTGMLRALGIEFYSADGERLAQGGGELSKLAHYDDRNLDKRLLESKFTIASDVTNILCGPNGASAVFGPQKGATPSMVEQLDRGLYQFSKVVNLQKGINLRELKGGGAAGGMGAALMAFCQAECRSGIDVILEQNKLLSLIDDADLLITGEGKLDKQTLSGKVIAGVAKIAAKKHVPVLAVCGSIDLTANDLNQLGLLSAFSIVPGPCTLEQAIENSPQWISNRTELILKMFFYNKDL